MRLSHHISRKGSAYLIGKSGMALAAMTIVFASLLLVSERVTCSAVTDSMTAEQQETPARMPALTGEKAITHLKEQDVYNSLQEAMAAVRYEARWQAEPQLAKQQQGIGKFSVSHTLLRDGDNQVRLLSLNGSGDVSLVDCLRVSYQHRFRADDDALILTLKGREQVTISGFSSRSIRVFDVTDEANVKELLVEIRGEKSGGYSIRVASHEAGERRLLALTDEKARQAEAIRANEPSSWRAKENAADFVILTSREFLAALEPLRARRESEGLRVALVDIEDLYDEFSFGHKTPQSVKDFLSYAKANWELSPHFVMFAGDASYDPKNYLGLGEWDVVPTKLLDTAFLETASDDWFSDFNGDSISDLAMGRLPVRTSEEAATMVGKILRYEEAGGAASVLLVADANDGFDFEQANAELRRFIPPNVNIEEIRRGQAEAQTAKAPLLEALARGQQVVNYVGHASVQSWRGNLLTASEARELTNAQLAVFVMMSCLNGYFQDAGLDSLSEALLKAERGGAVAVWASSGLTYPQGQAQMNRAFYEVLFAENGGGSAKDAGSRRTLGKAVQLAKAAIGDTDVRRTWILLGDPTLRLK